jgi:predicted ferric reductase
MELHQDQVINIETADSAVTLQSLLLLLLSSVMGAMMAAVLLPAWQPGLTASILGPDPKIYWFLSRASAIVGLGLLWLSMALGLTITNKLARLWPGGPVAFDIHQYTSLLGLAFTVFHALILMGDQYISYSLQQVLSPFFSGEYMPLWVGLGQLGLYVWFGVALSFYFRKQMGTKNWRRIHYFSYAVFLLALLHGLVSGTDSSAIWMQRVYWFAGSSILFLTIYRILINLRLHTGNAKPRANKKLSY